MQMDLDVDLVGDQVRVSRPPSRFRVDPRIGGRSRHEIDFPGQVDDRLAVARGSDARAENAIRLDHSVLPQAEVVVGGKDAIDAVVPALPL